MNGMLRQGDILLVPVEKLPRTTRTSEVSRVNGRIVLMEGEATGHAHTIADRGARLIVRRPTHRLEAHAGHFPRYLVVDEPVELTHEEHDAVSVPPGLYEVRRQREYAPRRVRWVSD